MNIRPKILLLGFVAIALVATAQQQDAGEKKAVPKPRPIPVYLGRSDNQNGPIAKSVFDQLIGEGLTSKDSTGKVYRVDGFMLTFAERNLYEDTTGQMMIQTDYLSEICYGDSLTTFLKNVMRERTKKGDTIIFDQLTVRDASGKGTHGKPMKFWIQK